MHSYFHESRVAIPALSSLNPFPWMQGGGFFPSSTFLQFPGKVRPLACSHRWEIIQWWPISWFVTGTFSTFQRISQTKQHTFKIRKRWGTFTNFVKKAKQNGDNHSHVFFLERASLVVYHGKDNYWKLNLWIWSKSELAHLDRCMAAFVAFCWSHFLQRQSWSKLRPHWLAVR